jgi:chromosome segregation ATPase
MSEDAGSVTAPQPGFFEGNEPSGTGSTLDAFLDKELFDAHSDSDRVFVYQRAFDFLSSQFLFCRPLLQRIRHHYDVMSKSLLNKKRETVMSETDESRADDSYTEIVSRVKRIKTQEFVAVRADAEKLLDELTALRLQRLELLNQLESLNNRREELVVVESGYEDKLYEINTTMREIIDDTKNIQGWSKDGKEQIEIFRNEIKKMKVSLLDLKVKAEAMQGEIVRLRQREREDRVRLFDMDASTGEILPLMKHLERELENAKREEKEANRKKREALAKRTKLSTELEKLLGDRKLEEVTGLMGFEC